MIGDERPLSRLAAKRQEQTPQAFARLVVVCLFIALWLVLLAARIPMPVPFLLVLLAEVLFFAVYLRVVAVLPSVRSVEIAQCVMLAAEIIFHTTIVYFLGGISWLGAFAYVFGLIFANTFLDMRRGLAYTAGASAAFISLIALEASGAVPHYAYLDQGPLRYADPRFVATTAIAGFGVFFSIFLWVNWVGYQLRRERDAALRAQDDLLEARGQLQLANEGLELRVRLRTAELETANAALRESEERLRTVVSNAPVVLFALDTDGVFTLAEGKGLDDIGTSADRVIGRSVYEIYGESPAVLEAVQMALAGEQATTVAETGGSALEAHMGPVFGPGGGVLGVIGVATNITERKRTESLLAEQRRLLEMIAVAAPIEAVLEALVRMIEDHSDGTICSICLASEDGSLLRPLAGPSLPEGFAEALREGVPIAPSAGSCGTAAYRREAVIVSDISTDPLWQDYRELALDHGLRACWSTPIVSHAGDVFGTFAMYYREPRAPDLHEQGLMQIATRIASIAVERMRDEQALRESEERYRWLIESAPYALVIVDDQGRIVIANTETEKLFAYDRKELLGEPVEILIPERFRDGHLGHRASYHAQPHARPMAPNSDSLIAQRKDGSQFPVEISLSPLKTDQGLLVTAAIQDITERKRAEQALRDQARRDPLTAVLNRRAGLAAIHEQLEVAKEEDGRFAALVLDLDRFKSINDNFSHEAGDTALLLFTRVLEDLVVDDGVICRLGGDEFEIGLPHLNLEQALVFGERILTALQRAQEHVERPGGPRFTVSIGVACFPEDGDNVATLGRRADEGMYAAKAAGGNRHRAWRYLASRNAA
jgi:diguanylate cyclase (GGDEF)-like protein/PAS domain S-box-containing protein